MTSVDDVPPPIVQIGPANQTLPLQSVATLPCQAIGTPQPRIKWYKNGSPLVSQGTRVKVMETGTLHIDGEWYWDDSRFKYTAVILCCMFCLSSFCSVICKLPITSLTL